MKRILKDYYLIDITVYNCGYFCFNNEIYYLCEIEDFQYFYTVYQTYKNYLLELQIQGYELIKNIYNEYYSERFILLRYIKQEYSLHSFISLCIQPLYFPPLLIKDIKEQWIHKIDAVRTMLQDYVNKQNYEVIPIIHYYLGIGETSISLLNEILKYNQNASIPLSLSLQYPILNNDKDILNPCHYIISSRQRLLDNLIHSQIINIQGLIILLNNNHFQYHEYIYLYARILYPSMIYNEIINHTFDVLDICLYKQKIKEEKERYENIYDILKSFISLPKIYWINN